MADTMADEIHLNKSSRRPKVWRLAQVRSVAAILVVPLVCVLLTSLVVLTRLEQNEKTRQESVARVAATWLADRLALTDTEERISILKAAEEKLGVRIGLFTADGDAQYESGLAMLGKEVLHTVFSGKRRIVTIANKKYFIASYPLRSQSKRVNVVVAYPFLSADWSILGQLGRFLLVALVLVLAMSVLGLSVGLDYRSMLKNAICKLNAAIYIIEQRPQRHAASYAEVGDLSEAIGRLSDQYEAEVALFEDALDEVETLDESRKDLLSAVSLELREPLDAVIDLAQELLSGKHGPLTDSQSEDVRIVSKAGSRLREMVEEILDFSSLLTSKISFDPSAVDLAEVARDVYEAGRGQIGKKRIEIKFEIKDDKPVLVNGNRQRLWQVATNLVGNAIKFTDSGEVVIGVFRKDGRAHLEVRDTGVGISSLELMSIFDAYKQVGGKPNRKKGTGLGLAICKRLVDLHRGRISITSAVGEGSKFTVILPEVEK